MKNQIALIYGAFSLGFVAYYTYYHIFIWSHITEFTEADFISKIRTQEDIKPLVNKKQENYQFWENDSICNRIRLNDDSMTSEALSHFEISCDKFNSKCNVIINAVTWSKTRKSIGGDIFLLWAEQTNGDGRSIGDVTDNGNGTYTGVIEFYWRGETVIKVKLGGTLENYCRRKKSMIKYGNSVFANKVPWGIKATYENRFAKEETRCGLHERIQCYPKICNLTHLNDGVPWFCGQPRHPKLRCGDLLEYNDGAFTRLTGDPPTNSGDVISNFGHGELTQTVTLRQVRSIDQKGQIMACRTLPKRYSWFSTGGFYLNGTWNIPYCESKLSFSKEACRKCLENKTVVVLGDSTVRDYASFFLSETMEFPLIDLKHAKSKNNTYHPDSDLKQYGVRIIYKKHELPFHHPHVPIKGVTSVATELIELARNSISGDDLIVLFNYNSHMYAFPPAIEKNCEGNALTIEGKTYC